MNNTEWLTSKQVAEKLGVTQAALSKWREKNYEPKFYRFNGTYRYKSDDVEKFLRQSVNC